MQLTLKATKAITPRAVWKTILAIRQLYVKSCLIAQGRIDDLVVYDKTGDGHFEDEFRLIVDTEHKASDDMPIGSVITLTGDDGNAMAMQAVQEMLVIAGWKENREEQHS